MKLDKTKPYGEVFGDPHIKYEQNHRFFNEQGEEVDGEGKPIVEKTDKKGK